MYLPIWNLMPTYFQDVSKILIYDLHVKGTKQSIAKINKKQTYYLAP